jgi:phosphoglycerate dehydrogenase-like enzyme
VRIAVLDDYQYVASGFADWTTLPDGSAVEFFHDNIQDVPRLAARLAPFDVVVAMRERTPFAADLLDRLPDLKLLVTTGSWNAVIDIEHARRRGVLVCGTGSRLTCTTELTWGLILALARGIRTEDAAVRAGRWQQGVGMDLRGRTLGLVGLGKLGTAVGAVGQVFGMNVIAWSTNLTAARAAAVGVRAVPKGELFGTSDVVSVHLKLSARTHHIVGADELRSMRDTAYLVNTSRGPLVDEDALVIALREGWIAGAGLDVFDQEPLPPAHALRHLPNTVLTPHIGYVTRGTYEIFFRDAVECISAYAAGGPVRVL